MTKPNFDPIDVVRQSPILILAALAFYSGTAVAADRIWTDLDPGGASHFSSKSASIRDPRFRSYRHLAADLIELRSVLAAAKPILDRGQQAPQLSLPMPDGRLLDFIVSRSPVMAPGLAARFPQIGTFKVRSVADASITGRIDIGPHGFHAFLMTVEGSVFIDPATRRPKDGYVSYFKRDYLGSGAIDTHKQFSCGVHPRSSQSGLVDSTQTATATTASNNILVYRLAAATTGEYSQAVAGGDATNTLAEVVTAVNRVAQIFERDLGIRMLLVANNDSLIYTDAATDPYTNLDLDALLIENQSNIDSVIGSSNYDIGHVFATSDGGFANIEAVCDDTAKAGGATGLDNPVGDAFYIDYLAHEFGHQFGADHTYNGTTYLCGDGNRNPRTAFEPGSGSTIMSYGGICDEENVQDDPDPLSPEQGFMDPTFHAGSIEQVLKFVQGGIGASCPSTVAVGNTAPEVDAGPDYTIPAATAFVLDGSATDINAGDVLMHQWDQMDAGFRTDSTSYGTDLVTNALFRSFVPVVSASRTLPQVPTLLGGVPDKAETLPVTSRSLNFRLTVRDNNGGVNDDTMRVIVDNSKGPFTLLQPNTAVTLNTLATQVIEWNAACTEQAPISCNNVDIFLSTSGGSDFNPLLLSVPNDGVQPVAFPAITSSSARIKIACSNNIFFDIADVNFALAQDGSGITLTESGNGGSDNCGTGIAAGADQEPNDTPADAQSITIPFSIDGTANSDQDVDDYYTFTVTQSNLTYTFDLSIPDNASLTINNHDLFLLDGSGNKQIAQSVRTGSADESISMVLTSGATYYVRVSANNTLGQDSTYTLSGKSTQATPPVTGGKSGGGGTLSIFASILLWLWLCIKWARKAIRRACDQHQFASRLFKSTDVVESLCEYSIVAVNAAKSTFR